MSILPEFYRTILRWHLSNRSLPLITCDRLLVINLWLQLYRSRYLKFKQSARRVVTEIQQILRHLPTAPPNRSSRSPRYCKLIVLLYVYLNPPSGIEYTCARALQCIPNTYTNVHVFIYSMLI